MEKNYVLCAAGDVKSTSPVPNNDTGIAKKNIGVRKSSRGGVSDSRNENNTDVGRYKIESRDENETPIENDVFVDNDYVKMEKGECEDEHLKNKQKPDRQLEKKSKRRRKLKKILGFVKNKLKTKDVDDDDKNGMTVFKSYDNEPPLTECPRYMHHTEMDEEKLKFLLARRSCHLPGNSWWQDWLQYVGNLHPLFGLCLHHQLHPLTINNRIYMLIASVAYGIIATNLVYFYFLLSDKQFEEDMIKLNLEIQEKGVMVALSTGIVMLFILNGLIHVMFDLWMWHLSSATCCSHFKHHRVIKKYGTYAVTAISMILVVFASCLILARLSYNINDEVKFEWSNMIRIESVYALLFYVLELFLVYFIINPIMISLKFSGVFGCMPGMGGRPGDIGRILDELMKDQVRFYRGQLKCADSFQDYDLV
jgi:hypothetical protein